MGKKRILVKEAGISDFFKAFFQAKADNKEEKFISAVKSQDERLANALSSWSDNMEQQLVSIYRASKAKGYDTTDIIATLKKYGIPIPK